MSPTFPDISISTDRLVLRPYEEADIPALVEMMNDEPVVAWTGAPHPYTAEHARAFVAGSAAAERERGRGLVLAVTEFLTQRLVGTVRLHHTDWRIRGTEAEYLTASWARGEGYASESLLALCRWLFREQGFQRVELRTPADNTAAQQVAQKIGCVSEGVLRAAGIVRTRPEGESGGDWAETRTDLLVWSLLAEDLDDPADRRGPGAPRHGDEAEYGSVTGGVGGNGGFDPAYPGYADWR